MTKVQEIVSNIVTFFNLGGCLMAEIGEPENLVPEGFGARFVKTEGFWEGKNDETRITSE